jgi:hypothetical protein
MDTKRPRANPRPSSRWIGTKRPASRDRSEGAVRLTHHMAGIERPRRQTNSFFKEPEFEPIFSLRCHTEQAESTKLAANFSSRRMTFRGSTTRSTRHRVLVEPDGIEPTTSCLQSRRSPS